MRKAMTRWLTGAAIVANVVCRQVLPALAHNGAVLGGGAAVVYGVGLMHVPAAWIIGGVLAIAGAILNARGSG